MLNAALCRPTESTSVVAYLYGNGWIVLHQRRQHSRLHATALQGLLIFLDLLDYLHSVSWVERCFCASSQGLNGDADVPDMTNRVRGSAELLLQRKTALWDFIVPAQLSWDTWARHLQLQCHHCDIALAYACDVSSPYKDWTLLSARFTLCWSIGSKGPSKAAAMMPFPSVMLLSATSSGSTSGMEGSREHHSAWPAHSQKDSSAQKRDGLREQPLADTDSCNVTEDAPSKGVASSNAALADSLLP